MTQVTSPEAIFNAMQKGGIPVKKQNGSEERFTEKGRLLPASGDNPYANLKYVKNPAECPKCHVDIEVRGAGSHIRGCNGDPKRVLRARAIKLAKQIHGVTPATTEMWDVKFDDDNNVISVDIIPVPDDIHEQRGLKTRKTAMKKRKQREKEAAAAEAFKNQVVIPPVSKIESKVSIKDELDTLISFMEERVSQSDTVTIKQFNEWKKQTSDLWMAS